MLARLSVFSGGFRMAAVIDVCTSEALAKESAVEQIVALVRKSLVSRHDLAASPLTARYSLLETVRAFAAERLTQSGETAAVGRRHAVWAAGTLETIADLLMSRDEPAGLELRDAETPNILRGYDWAITRGDVDLAMRYAAATSRTGVHSQLAPLICDTIRDGRLAQLPGALDHPLAPCMWAVIAICRDSTDYSLSLDACRRADVDGAPLKARAAARQWMAGYARLLGSAEEQNEQISRLRQLAILAPDDHSLAATVAFNDALLATDAAEAERHHERARACAVRSGVPSVVALSLIISAFQCLRKGDLAGARNWADRAEPIVEAMRNHRMSITWRALLTAVRPTEEAMRVQVQRLRSVSELDQLDYGRVDLVRVSAQLLAAAHRTDAATVLQKAHASLSKGLPPVKIPFAMAAPGSVDATEHGAGADMSIAEAIAFATAELEEALGAP